MKSKSINIRTFSIITSLPTSFPEERWPKSASKEKNNSLFQDYPLKEKSMIPSIALALRRAEQRDQTMLYLKL